MFLMPNPSKVQIKPASHKVQPLPVGRGKGWGEGSRLRAIGLHARIHLVLFAAAWLIPPAAWSATNDFQALLQKGLFEEEANHNYTAAIQAYQGIASQSDEQRKIMATAIFRLGECYRKLAKTNEASGYYQRVAREFPEQKELAALSQQQLREGGGQATGAITADGGGASEEERKEIERLTRLAKDSPDLVLAQRPLHQAAGQGQLELAKFLIQQLKSPVNAKGNGGETPLHNAALNGQKSMIELLLRNGADVNARERANLTPLHLACSRGFLSVAKVLVESQADKEAKSSNGYEGVNPGSTPLHFAARLGFTALVKLLLEAGAEIDSRDSLGNSPLMVAVIASQTEAVKLLVGAKAAINSTDKDGDTPLLVSIKRQKEDLVKFLLDHGANVNMTNKQGRSALALAANPFSSRTSRGNPENRAAASTNIASLVLENGADVNGPDANGWTPLFFAVLSGEIPIAELLVAHKADVNFKDKMGQTPIFLAAAGQNDDTMVELLLSHYAAVNVVDNSGETPLRNYLKNRRQNTSPLLALLSKYGAKEYVQTPNFITATRAASNISSPVLYRGTNSPNQHTIFEVIAAIYASGQTSLPFPDFARVEVKALGAEKGRVIDLQTIFQLKDCRKDEPLEWGAAVEIPEADHQVNVNWGGLPQSAREFLQQCLARTVTMVVKGEPSSLQLQPIVQINSGLAQTREPNKFQAPITDFRLERVLKSSQLLRTSSDLTRVKVTRKDPATGQPREMLFDISTVDPRTDLFLRDGDVIEVPEKP